MIEIDENLRGAATRVLDSRPALLRLPAGHGKTHLLAAACALAGDRGDSVLVLTHTHAGVDSIRAKLARFAVPASRATVSTIDGWTRSLVAAFPKASDCVEYIKSDGTIDWKAIQAGAVSALQNPHVRLMVRSSYDVVLLDEYQDTGAAQHEAIAAAFEPAQIAIFADPLQAIFGFDGEALVDVGSDLSEFRPVHVESAPWRWVGQNAPLGTCLGEIRAKLEAGEQFDVRDFGINWVQFDITKTVPQCWDLAKTTSSVVIVRRWRHECVATAKKLRGLYGVMEAMDGAEILRAATAVDSQSGPKLAGTIAMFACECFTDRSDLKKKAEVMATGQFPSFGKGRLTMSLEILSRVANEGTPSDVRDALDAMSRIGGYLYCREAWFEFLRSVEDWVDGKHVLLEEAVRERRARLGLKGRRGVRRSVSRALLIKGLEFDHCIVIEPDLSSLPPQLLYVSMTRGSRSLTVVSASPVYEGYGG